MLAPRKKLWSTPISAVDHCMQRIPLRPNDKVVDIGCGDGRIILKWAELLTAKYDENDDESFPAYISFLGIDINPTRIEECQESLQQARHDNSKIHPSISIEFVCANALESSELIQDATVIFIYLIPRGIQQIYPLLKDHCCSKEKRKRQQEGGTDVYDDNDVQQQQQQQQETLRIASYMSKLPTSTDDDTIKPVGRALCHTDHQKDAAWPLYFYESAS